MEDPALFLNNNQTTAEGFLPLSPIGESKKRPLFFLIKCDYLPRQA
jgi:hypothetical protein